MKDWIAVTGLRAFDPAATHSAVSPRIMSDPDLSLEAKGPYALLVSFRGQPIDRFVDAIEDEEVIAGAIEELIAVGLAVGVARDRRGRESIQRAADRGCGFAIPAV